MYQFLIIAYLFTSKMSKQEQVKIMSETGAVKGLKTLDDSFDVVIKTAVEAVNLS